MIAAFSHKIRRNQSKSDQQQFAQVAFHYMPYLSLEGLWDGYDTYNQRIKNVASEANALLVENEMSIPVDDEHFYDFIHFTNKGCRMMANRIVEALEESEQFKNLLKENL